MSISNSLEPATEQDFGNFVTLCDSISEWKFSWENRQKSLTVWEQQNYERNSVRTLRVHVIFDQIDMMTLYDVIHDPDYRRVWDDNMIDCYTIEQVDTNNEIGYYSIRIFGCSNRDFVTKKSWRQRDNECAIISWSVEHPRAPPRPGFIRAETLQTGYLVRPEGNGCSLIFVSQTDLKGMIPSFVTKHAVHMVVYELQEAAAKYNEWKSQHNPNCKPWRAPSTSTTRSRRYHWPFF